MYDRKLLEKILDRDNLNLAYKQVVRNKGAAGVDSMNVDELGAYLALHKEELLGAIRQRKYQPQPVLRKEIPKPNGGVRLLGIPSVVDRFIQQAISQVLTPLFDKQFHENSYGFRPRRNAQMAIIQVLEFMNDGYDWIVDIDLERFFDTVHHDRLMNLLSRTIEDGDVLSIVRKYLESGIRINDEYKDSVVGMPQGGNLSPLLSNVMLHELDKELAKRDLRFVRYADDCIIFVKSEMSARRVMRSVTKFIEKKLGLLVNSSKSKVVKPWDKDFKFLGFGFFYDKEEEQYKAKPHALSVENFKYKLKELSKRNWGVSMDYRIGRINQVVRGWVNYFKIGKMKSVLRTISGHLRFRLRMCIWKQWKNAKTRIKALTRLGFTKRNAYQQGHSSKSYARVASSWIMTKSVTNKRLAQKGLISPDEYYLKQTCFA
jgi:RNA-directed DNA polymerase